MYRLEAQDYVKSKMIALWSLLAFQAGFINSIGFLDSLRFVSHVTGFSSQIGISLARGQIFLAIEMLSLPAAFITGAWFNGYLTVVRKSRGLIPRYDLVTLLMPIVLGILLLMGINGIFGGFGERTFLLRDFIFLGSLSFLCGMQNACFATLTKGQIRTTHLTGISTDFGTDLSLTLSGSLSAEELSLAKKRNYMRAATFIGFFSGALISALVDSQIGFYSLLIPFVTSSCVSSIFFFKKHELDRKENKHPN